MSTEIHDKYSEAVAYLTEHEDRIESTWFEPHLHRGGCLFTFCTPDGTRQPRPDHRMCGCLTMIRGEWALENHAWTDELTEAILTDERLPKSGYDIRPEHLPVFAEWQRRLDKELNRV